MVNAPAVVLLPVTDTGGIAHLVTEDAMIVGRHAGRYVACCGAEVIPASLTAPEAGHCRPCTRWRAER